jgi:hypothetical protein
MAFFESDGMTVKTFLNGTRATDCERSSVSDVDGIIGVGLLLPASAIDQPSRSIVYVRQDHPFSSTIADFLLSEQIRHCTRNSACHLLMLDIASRYDVR